MEVESAAAPWAKLLTLAAAVAPADGFAAGRVPAPALRNPAVPSLQTPRMGEGDSELKAVRALHVETPLLYSDPLSAALGKDVYLKMDAWQPPGSFKIRGIGETCRRAAAGGAKRLVSSSGGNAGLATAYAGRALGVPTTVVLPSTTPAFARDRLARYGADVEVHGDVWDEANQRAEEIVKAEDGVLIHPFDQESTWEGHATVVEEVAAQLPECVVPDVFVTVCGGGGLLRGIQLGLERVGWTNTKVLVCETDGAASMSESLRAGSLQTLDQISSIAKSLGALRVSPRVFEHCLRELEHDRLRVFTASDRDALDACLRFADDHRTLVEPACGVALASVYTQAPQLDDAQTVVVEVCGGALVTREMIEAWNEAV